MPSIVTIGLQTEALLNPVETDVIGISHSSTAVGVACMQCRRVIGEKTQVLEHKGFGATSWWWSALTAYISGLFWRGLLSCNLWHHLGTTLERGCFCEQKKPFSRKLSIPFRRNYGSKFAPLSKKRGLPFRASFPHCRLRARKFGRAR